VPRPLLDEPESETPHQSFHTQIATFQQPHRSRFGSARSGVWMAIPGQDAGVCGRAASPRCRISASISDAAAWKISARRAASSSVSCLMAQPAPKAGSPPGAGAHNATCHKVKTHNWHQFEALFPASLQPGLPPNKGLWLRLKSDWIAHAAARSLRTASACPQPLHVIRRTAPPSICSIR
jgi:hypothetical protein